MNCILQTPTPDLDQSIDFYTRLGFKQLIGGEHTVFSDGKAVVLVNTDRKARAGIRMYRQDWSDKLDGLRQLANVIEVSGGYLLTDPSGVYIYLINGDNPVSPTVADESFSLAGKYMGLSLETGDFPRSEALYKVLGFSLTAGGADKGWASFDLDGFGISLMPPLSCPHLFFNPSLTCFNGGKNLPVIEKIREAGIQVTEEITVFNKDGLVDNIIIRDPGGFGFFIFND
ncbi:MAG: hypothetical protein EOP49_06565 [Sphingobacteriales bacterium]|nr:MAG: hypothetical protein EOP49_06565 [Sphingobacteriales bacterium]